MRDTLPVELGLDPELYVPLRLGSTVIGWTPSLSAMLEDQQGAAVITVVMGESIMELDPQEVRANFLYRKTESEFSVISPLFNYVGVYLDPTILNLPAGSLNIDIAGGAYSPDDVETLFAALSDYLRLLHIYVQSELHRHPPLEVVKIVRILTNQNYSTDAINELLWRDEMLDELVADSDLLFFHQGSCGAERVSYVQHFNRFVGLHGGKLKRKKSGFGFTTEPVPNTVFFLKASTEEEYRLGEKLFHENYMNALIKTLGYNRSADAGDVAKVKCVFFFGSADDRLADWIEGTVIPISEIRRITERVGVS